MQARGAYYVLTGERDSGKTLVCTELAAEGRARGLDVAGILTARSGRGLHAPRQVIDLRSGASRLFGAPSQTGADPLTPGWEVDADVFVWATQVLSAAAPCDLLIVDEVGPLELLGGRGWELALDVLRKGDFGASLVVCRPSLLDKLEAGLGSLPARLFEAEPEQTDSLPDLILAEMFG
jgi:nucleoside-triphosphatase THEP1